MLVVNPLGPTAGRYYRDGPDRGTWCGGGAAALGLEGPVDPVALDRLLRGRHPASGEPLPLRPAPHRRAGWDLILAAPKSVSVLAGLAPPPRAASLAGAQPEAAAAALDWLEARACWARRDGRLVAGEGFLAARFDHRASDAGDPHLHGHVVLANLVRTHDGRWSALDGSALWLHRRALAAVYDLGLRHALEARGLRAGWALRGDGSWDVAAVPRAAVEAASRREAEVRGALPGAEPTRRARRAARARTRAAGSGGDWWAAVTAAGLGPAQAAELNHPGDAAPAAPATPGPEPALTAAVEQRLRGERSSWSRRDVLVALAATATTGATPGQAESWADGFARGCLPARGGRLSSPAAADLDRAVLDLARRAPPGIGLAAPAAVAASMERRPELDPAAREAVRRLTGPGRGVDLLGGGGAGEALVAQALVLDAAREAWAATGHRVVVAAGEGAARRWAGLAGLEPAGPTAGSVVVVDRADRLAPRELLGILEEASRVPAKVVLVRGGTLPARRSALCDGLEAIDATLGHVVPPATAGTGTPRRDDVLTTVSALDGLVSAWWSAGGGAHLVGLGPAEVVELNGRARRALRAAGVLEGPDAWLAGRPFAVGDRVIPLRREAGAPGSEGVVVWVDPGGSRRPPAVLVDWGGDRRRLDAWAARHVGHAYALTPAGLRVRPGRALLLGDPSALGRAAPRVDLALAAGLSPPGRARALEGPERLPPRRRGPEPPGRAPAGREPARDVPGLGW
ncbi:MAG TPA: MobF family relaxase [Acidimicrobiales bacterium]|nr:MobF family relaxase [Acidimicrobiales bacterium]